MRSFNKARYLISRRVNVRVLLIISFLIFPKFVDADDAKKVTLFFTPDMDKPVHSNSVNLGREALDGQGFSSHRQVVGTNYNYLLEEHPYKGFEKEKSVTNGGVDAFKENLKASYEEAGENGTVLLHVNNHGGVVDKKLPFPQAIGFSSYKNDIRKDQKLSMSSLLEEIKKLPKDRKLKLIGTHCGGGAIHHISHNIDNACSISPVDERKLYSIFRTDDGQRDYFNEGMYGEIKGKDKKFDHDGDGKTSLFEAWSAGMKQYMSGGGSADHSGMPSSFAYIDKVLDSSKGFGSYRSRQELKRQFPDEANLSGKCIYRTGCRADRRLDSLYCQAVFKLSQNYLPVVDRLKEENFEKAIADLPEATKKSLTTIRKSAKDELAKFQKEKEGDIDKLNAEYDALQAEKNGNKAKRDEISAEITKLIDRFNDELAPRELELRKKDRKGNLSDEESKEFAALQKEMREIRTKNRELSNQRSELDAGLQKKFDKLNEKAESLFGQIGYSIRVFQLTNSIAMFNSVASDEQKKKFKSLLACETEAL